MGDASSKACLRLAVNVAEWGPDGEHEGQEFKFLLALLPAEEQEKVMKFMRFEDKKRALVSRLLQRKCVSQVLGLDYDAISIRRTREGKPFLVNRVDDPSLPNFNFNATHHGDYVALVSEPCCLAGVDVMVHETRGRPQTVQEFMKAFTKCFTEFEWRCIWGGGDDDIRVYEQFYRFWCMKEAYIKAIGIGLGYDLMRIEFHGVDGDPWANEATVKVDGVLHEGWRLFLHPLGRGHWACVARGPPKEAIESYKRTLPNPEVDEAVYQEELHAPSGTFQMMMVGDLVPEALLAEYEGVGGEVLEATF
mmetsp:Transcript_67395/g.213327  ORF Transcript_67395/g.213327 Transcript_67395/m.213327 type:complete len:306 (-) Transcript_67395:109-1026(-)|eukprot:CAMPEP_0182854402 /NCGR_PEP_ID=MMETSP0034_2-20130328/1231_1 /TAXON_ID=156128 /ORGANISM="Nephroselmis pyriformis, Strain CCMP717" /LENGTH=305 /DNA_ID=CAMNT_0024985231 /DNA_START=162 /DNA_END=1079 /DNA_ORIENTATION=+